MELHRWWLYTNTKPLALPVFVLAEIRSPEIDPPPSLFRGRSIRFKKKKKILDTRSRSKNVLSLLEREKKRDSREMIIFICGVCGEGWNDNTALIQTREFSRFKFNLAITI